MADAIPLKAVFNPDDSIKSLAEFTVADNLAVTHGGTGVATLGTAIGGAGITVADGAGAVVKSFSISVDGASLVIPGDSMTGGTIDGGSYV